MANIILQLTTIILALNSAISTARVIDNPVDYNHADDQALDKRGGRLPHEGLIQSTRPMYWYPTNHTLPLANNWAASGWKDCEIWQKPRNIWGCHEGHSIEPWIKHMLKLDRNPRDELRKLLQKVFQDPLAERPVFEPRSECIQPSGTSDPDVQICVSWGDVFFDQMTDVVLERVLDKALSCGAQGQSSMIMARMVDWENRVICISNRAKGCKNTICDDAPSMGAIHEQCNGIDYLDSHFLFAGFPGPLRSPCIKRSPAEQLDQFDMPLDFQSMIKLVPFYPDLRKELKAAFPGWKHVWKPVDDDRFGSHHPVLLPVHPSLYSDNLKYKRPKLPDWLD